MCDDEWDCEDGMDEKNCIHTDTVQECFGDRFKCDDGQMCVNMEFKCDGTEDCKDGSDESLEICGREIREIILISIIIYFINTITS